MENNDFNNKSLVWPTKIYICIWILGHWKGIELKFIVIKDLGLYYSEPKTHTINFKIME